MRKFIQQKLKEQKGLTLIELLAVIVILAIIAAIAIPAIANIIENSRVGAIKSDALNVISAGELYFTDLPEEPSVTLEDLIAEGYMDDAASFDAPASVTVTKKTSTTGATPVVTPTNITGVGKTGGLQVEFLNANKEDIASYANSERGAATDAAVDAGDATP